MAQMDLTSCHPSQQTSHFLVACVTRILMWDKNLTEEENLYLIKSLNSIAVEPEFMGAKQTYMPSPAKTESGSSIDPLEGRYIQLSPQRQDTDFCDQWVARHNQDQCHSQLERAHPWLLMTESAKRGSSVQPTTIASKHRKSVSACIGKTTQMGISKHKRYSSASRATEMPRKSNADLYTKILGPPRYPIRPTRSLHALDTEFKSSNLDYSSPNIATTNYSSPNIASTNYSSSMSGSTQNNTFQSMFDRFSVQDSQNGSSYGSDSDAQIPMGEEDISGQFRHMQNDPLLYFHDHPFGITTEANTQFTQAIQTPWMLENSSVVDPKKLLHRRQNSISLFQDVQIDLSPPENLPSTLESTRSILLESYIAEEGTAAETAEAKAERIKLKPITRYLRYWRPKFELQYPHLKSHKINRLIMYQWQNESLESKELWQ